MQLRAAGGAHAEDTGEHVINPDGSINLALTSGYESILEIARQSVPEGYGNSYFWVKPPRIVSLSRTRKVMRILAPTFTCSLSLSVKSAMKRPPSGNVIMP